MLGVQLRCCRQQHLQPAYHDQLLQPLQPLQGCPWPQPA
jgi:hypothetical protein